MTKQTNSSRTYLGFEAQFWAAANKLRGNMDPSDFRHVVRGLIFLKCISDAFEAKLADLLAEELAYPEFPEEYLAENVLLIPGVARWLYLQVTAKLPATGKDIDDAMPTMESRNASFKGILPKEHARPTPKKDRFGELIYLVSGIGNVMTRRHPRCLGRGRCARTFTRTRDLLLPKPMSSEIRLPDVKRVVKAVAQ